MNNHQGIWELLPAPGHGMAYMDFGGGSGQAEAAAQAAGAQVKAAKIAAGTQLKMYEQTRTDISPWREAGGGALNQYQYLLGLKTPPGYGGYQEKTGTFQVGTYNGTPVYSQNGTLYLGTPPTTTGTTGTPATGTTWAPGQYTDAFTTSQAYRGDLGTSDTAKVHQILSPIPANALFVDPATGTIYGGGGVTQSKGPGGTWQFSPKQGDTANMLQYYGIIPSLTTAGQGTTTTGTPFTGDQSQISWLSGMQPQQYKPGEYAQKFLENTPGYQFALQEGINSLDKSAAARGMLLSGAQNRALTKYGQDYASLQYNTLLDRIANLSGSGQNAAAQLGSIGSNTATGIAATQMASGQAQAQAYMNAANARQSAYNQGVNSLMGLGGLGLGAYNASNFASMLGGGGAGLAGLFGPAGAGISAADIAVTLEPALAAMGFLSDKRAKKRIRPLRRGNALAKVRALTPVSFAYKNKYGGGPDQAGLLAEDVAKAIPEAVTTGPDGMKRVNPMALNALVVQAIKELDNV